MTVVPSSFSILKLLEDSSSEIRFSLQSHQVCSIAMRSPGSKSFGDDPPFFWASSTCLFFLFPMSLWWSTNLLTLLGRWFLGALPKNLLAAVPPSPSCGWTWALMLMVSLSKISWVTFFTSSRFRKSFKLLKAHSQPPLYLELYADVITWMRPTSLSS